MVSRDLTDNTYVVQQAPFCIKGPLPFCMLFHGIEIVRQRFQLIYRFMNTVRIRAVRIFKFQAQDIEQLKSGDIYSKHNRNPLYLCVLIRGSQDLISVERYRIAMIILQPQNPNFAVELQVFFAEHS